MADVLHAGAASASAHASANIRHLCRTELPGGGQIVIQRHHAYVGHQNGPEGTTILDISDPRKPKIVSRLMVPNELTHTHKVASSTISCSRIPSISPARAGASSSRTPAFASTTSPTARTPAS